MVFNLDASNRPVIGLEGRTCCYPHKGTNTSFSSPSPSFSQSHHFTVFSRISAFFIWNDQAPHFLSPPYFSSFFHAVLSSSMFSFLLACPSEPHTPLRDEAVWVFVCVRVWVYEVSQLGSLPSQLWGWTEHSGLWLEVICPACGFNFAFI